MKLLMKYFKKIGFLTSYSNWYQMEWWPFYSILGLGVGMSRDPAALMVGQYFKRKRELVEIILVSGSGFGITIMSIFIKESIGWVKIENFK